MPALLSSMPDARQSNGPGKFLLSMGGRETDSVTLPSVDLAAYCTTSDTI